MRIELISPKIRFLCGIADDQLQLIKFRTYTWIIKEDKLHYLSTMGKISK